MSSAPPGAGAHGDPPGGPGEEELRAAYEAELARVAPADMMLQAAVSLLNIGARRLGLTGAPEQRQEEGAPAGGAGGRDLGQVRDAIDGVMALLAVLERGVPEEQLRPLRDALSQLQLAYARAAPAGGEGDADKQRQKPGEGEVPDGGDRPRPPGPAEASGRLWVPGS